MNKGLLCSGNISIALLGANDAFNGFAGIQNTVKLSIAPEEGEIKKRKSKMISNYGAILDSIIIPGGWTIEMEIDDAGDKEVLGYALLGSLATANVAAGTAATATIPDIKLGVWYKLPHRFVTVTQVAYGTTPPLVSVNSNNYQVDTASGMIRINGGAADGDTVEVTYDHAVVTADRISAGTKQQLNVRIYGTLRNLTTGKNIVLDIPKASLVPKDEIDWLSGDFAVASLSGDIVSIGSNPPFTATVDA